MTELLQVSLQEPLHGGVRELSARLDTSSVTDSHGETMGIQWESNGDLLIINGTWTIFELIYLLQ